MHLGRGNPRAEYSRTGGVVGDLAAGVEVRAEYGPWRRGAESTRVRAQGVKPCDSKVLGHMVSWIGHPYLQYLEQGASCIKRDVTQGIFSQVGDTVGTLVARLFDA